MMFAAVPPWLRTTSLLLLLLSALAGLWLSSQQQQVRSFIAANSSPEFQQIQQLQPLFNQLMNRLDMPAEHSGATLINFWNPDCRCNQYTLPHFQNSIAPFNAAELHIITLLPPNTDADKAAALQALNPKIHIKVLTDDLNFDLPSSPALAILDSQQRLSFFGAYGFGAQCTLDDENIYVNFIRRLLNQPDVPYGPFLNIAGRGCFCDWQ